jgi:hypothetical protein
MARIVGWATAEWVGQAHVLPQQDDRYAQSRLVGGAAGKSGSEPGTVVSLRRAIRLLELATAQGWTGGPNYGGRCIRFLSLAWLHDAASA